MVKTIAFIQSLSVAVIVVAFVSGVLYWMYVFVKKSFPDLRYTIKYRLLRKKYRTEDVSGLLDDIENGVDENELFKSLILSNRENKRRSRELIYIYRKLKVLKGGKIQ